MTSSASPPENRSASPNPLGSPVSGSTPPRRWTVRASRMMVNDADRAPTTSRKTMTAERATPHRAAVTAHRAPPTTSCCTMTARRDRNSAGATAMGISTRMYPNEATVPPPDATRTTTSRATSVIRARHQRRPMLRILRRTTQATTVTTSTPDTAATFVAPVPTTAAVTGHISMSRA